ncbi:hypothetical protein A5681_13555, partial [Mycobacterium scrofulaceum]|uniref:13E12 repeat family protein n=1 Tax=Mycobacterium scrofulaceum TaxID=1783 RepID=UPI0007FE5DFF
MFDTRLHEYWEPPRCERSRALLERMCASWRVEAQVVAGRLDAVGELFELRRAQRGEEPDWAVDTWAAVGAEVAAAFRVSLAMSGSFMRYALAMRDRLPRVAEVFRAGDISYRLFQTIVYRTDLITDAAALAAVDTELAVRAARWPSMTRGRLAGEVDKIVAKADVDAVRRRDQSQAERWVGVEDLEGGMSEIRGSLFSPDAHALDRRLDALAATVCEHDPRSVDQRRADALGVLAAGADRLGCRCGLPDCTAGKRPSATPVVIHVIAEQASVEGAGSAPASEVGADALITAEVVAELAGTAKLVPLAVPDDAEPRYTPSTRLADFVRCRDLTCRAPGCDRPAVDC